MKKYTIREIEIMEAEAKAKAYKREKRNTKARKETTTKAIKRRERATKGILRAIGVISGEQRYGGPGRSRGSYIHGMPIHVWKALQKQKERQRQEFEQEQYQKLASRGFTPEQVQQLQQQQTVEELQQPSVPQAMQQLQQRQERIDVLRQAQQGQMPQGLQPEFQQMPQEIQRNQNIMRQRYAQDMPFNNPSDEDLNFTRWRAERTVSPNTQRMLTEVRRIQLLGKTSNIEHERRNRERKMMSNALNLMQAHTNMTPVHMDFTGVSEENILMAPNIWRENPENNILKPRGISILNTNQSGNDLNFW